MKCPNCEEKKYKKLRRFYKDDVTAYWCIRCGTVYGPRKDYKKDIPINSKWLSFNNEPPPQDENTELIFLFFDNRYGQFEADVGYWIGYWKNSNYVAEYGDPVWWQPIGSLPEVPG
jgi:hypothetical protein